MLLFVNALSVQNEPNNNNNENNSRPQAKSLLDYLSKYVVPIYRIGPAYCRMRSDLVVLYLIEPETKQNIFKQKVFKKSKFELSLEMFFLFQRLKE